MHYPDTSVLPTPAYIRRALRYDPKTGKLRWRRRPRIHFPDSRAWHSQNARMVGKEAGTGLGGGYGRPSVGLGGLHINTDALAWVLMTGEWLDTRITHIDGDHQNNRWSNLREKKP